MRAVIERNENAEFCASVKQSAFFRVFAHGVHVGAIWNSIYNRAPSLSQIGGFKNVWLEVVEFMSIHRDVRSVAVVWRRIDEIYRAPLRHFWRDV